MARIHYGISDSFNGFRARNFILDMPSSTKGMFESYARSVAEFYYDDEMLKVEQAAKKEIIRRYRLDDESLLLEDIDDTIAGLITGLNVSKTAMQVALANIKAKIGEYNHFNYLGVEYLVDRGLFTKNGEGYKFQYRYKTAFIEFI